MCPGDTEGRPLSMGQCLVIIGNITVPGKVLKVQSQEDNSCQYLRQILSRQHIMLIR